MDAYAPLVLGIYWPAAPLGGVVLAGESRHALMQQSHRLIVAEVEIDLQRHQVYLSGKPVEFSATEFRVLTLLATTSGRAFTREQILSGVHGHALVTTPRAVDFQICSIRRKLGPFAAYLKTIRGVGYRFEPPIGPTS